MNQNLTSGPFLDTATEKLIRQVVHSILAPAQKGECKCHWIEASKIPILAWKSTKDPNTLVLKIATQKLIGLTRVDKNGTEYWKFRNAEQLSESESASNQTSAPPAPVEPTTESTSPQPVPEPKVNLPASESEAVQKFQQKYGTATNPKT